MEIMMKTMTRPILLAKLALDGSSSKRWEQVTTNIKQVIKRITNYRLNVLENTVARNSKFHWKLIEN